jgi:septum formation protein
VLTGVYLCRPDDGRSVSGVESTRVTFRDLDDATIVAYATSGEGADKAGGYAMQGRGVLLTRGIEGSWSNVVGLPLERLPDWLTALGVDIGELA